MPVGPAMPPIGPAMPSKRTRDDASDASDSSASDSSSSKRRRVAGPAPPPSRPARVMGPAPPPANLDERPSHPPSDDSDSSDDDDFGPAPPPAGTSHTSTAYPDSSHSAFDTDPHFAHAPASAPNKPQRDDWMTLPPTQDDLAARLDPTKQRARKFNSKSTTAPAGASSAWTETPDQKLKRLQAEALGIAPAPAPGSSTAPKSKEEDRRARAMRDKIDAARGKSLVEQHQAKKKIEEDDPSKRVFDYEKDMAVQGSLNHKQKRDVLAKSKGFGDRFSSGSFL